MSITKSDVTFHRPQDNSDQGFKVKGYTLRWVSGGVESRRAPRFWEPLKLSKFPKEVQDAIKKKVGRLYDGDLIRRRDLILSMAPNDVVAERKKEKREQQNANEAVFRANQRSQEHSAVKTTGDTGMGNERMSSENFNI